tara:strand:+ start:565 stop:1323 length:759 start_codon:yes stop_codon:yes gene_type:complete
MYKDKENKEDKYDEDFSDDDLNIDDVDDDGINEKNIMNNYGGKNSKKQSSSTNPGPLNVEDDDGDLDDDDEDIDDDDEDDEDDEEDDDDDKNSESDKTEKDKLSLSNISNLEIANTFNKNMDYLENEDINMEKYTNDYKNNYIINCHPECLSKNYNEIKELVKVIRNENNIIVDEFHKTLPILSKYEKTKILGLRIKQLNNNSKPYINVDENIIDNFIIANMELQEKKLPFIIERPIQNRFEYWNIKDLEIL